MRILGHPFTSLVGPLRYACRRDFAQLAQVRDLRSPLQAAIASARSAGIAASVTDALARELEHVDAPQVEERKASLVRVVRYLRDAGVELPEELGAMAQASAAAAPSAPASPSRRAEVDAGPLFRAATPARATSAVTREPAPLAEPEEPPPFSDDDGPPPLDDDDGPQFADEEPQRPAPGGKRRKKAVGLAESKGEARLMSIAPREGPLAVELRKAGWRMNPRLLSALEKKGVKRVGDVLFLLPRCYEDRRKLQTIAQLRPGERGVAVGTVLSAGEVPVRGRGRIFRAVIGDRTGSISVTYFRSGPWLRAKFPVGKKLVVSGEVRASYSGREIAHPEVEPAEDIETSSVHFNRIVPIYPGFERHEQRSFRELAHRICEKYGHALEDPLPADFRARLKLTELSEAIRAIHFPADGEDLGLLDRHLSPAHRRLAFDELFFLQLGLSLKRQGVKRDHGIAFNVAPERIEKAKAALPFSLTDAQARVVKEIARDMGRPEPMNRLLQGDVGSGKTAVAMVTAQLALQDGHQVAVMAPTEILAEQHARSFEKVLGALGYRVSLFTSGGTAKERRKQREALASGEIQVAVGTHALIQEDVEYARLGVVIIDEQHRFGVIQRHALIRKGIRPDTLVMTATPIPRTLAMTMYGDLERSLIDQLPPGRTPVKTKVFGEKQRAKVYDAMRAELAKGHQCYVVYPLVEESEKLDLADATRGAETLQAEFPDHKVGLVHGRMKPEEKDAAMEDFRAKRTHILVSTTVIEVGVDVPNASVMAIEHAERFGLSQLHQLRGRVGRGAAVSYCFLVSAYARSKEAADRLAVMERTNDGLVIAEKDLELRGPGEFLGTRQSGMPELAVANLARDVDLVDLAHQEAREIVEADPRLEQRDHLPLRKALEDRWEGRLALAQVG